MSCCCTKIYKFCKFVTTCSSNDFKEMFEGLADGTFTVVLDFVETQISITITVANNVVTLPDPLLLNEHFTYTGTVIDAQRQTVNIVKNDASYDCFQFTTKS